MDISKYIGLFLLKNHFCYIPGIGNLELKKLPAKYDGKLLLPSVYQIEITSGGSIDDNLAYFIAANEQVSISKASNELKDFSTNEKKNMEAGKPVVLPGLGKIVFENSKYKFIADDKFIFTPPGLPTIRNTKQIEEPAPNPTPIPVQNTAAPIPVINSSPQQPIKPELTLPPPVIQPKRTINWTLIIIIIVAAVILGSIVLGFFYFKSTKNSHHLADVETGTKSTIIDSPKRLDFNMNIADSIRNANAQNIPDSIYQNIKVVLGTYPDLASAETKKKKLQLTGDNLEILIKDTATYLLLGQVNCRMIDTSRVFDSLRRAYNYDNVREFKR